MAYTSMIPVHRLKGSVDYTVVNGRIAVRDGRLVNVDEDRIVEKANAAVENYING